MLPVSSWCAPASGQCSQQVGAVVRRPQAVSSLASIKLVVVSWVSFVRGASSGRVSSPLIGAGRLWSRKGERQQVGFSRQDGQAQPAGADSQQQQQQQQPARSRHLFGALRQLGQSKAKQRSSPVWAATSIRPLKEFNRTDNADAERNERTFCAYFSRLMLCVCLCVSACLSARPAPSCVHFNWPV